MKQNTKEWLARRKHYIGASEAPIIMGVSPYKRSDGRKKTPYILWMEKLDLLPQDKETDAMRFGKANEALARHEYQNIVRVEVEPEVIYHPTISYLLASLDGISKDKTLAVEIKSANREDHELAKTNKVPAKYYPQVQQQLACTELDGMHYFSFHKGEGVIVEVARDDNYLEEMYEKEKEFWDCVEKFKPPKMTKDDFFEQNESWYAEALKLMEIKERKKELEEAEKETEKRLRMQCLGQNSYFKDLCYVSSIRKGNVDYSKIPELQEVNLDSYRKPTTEIWRLSRF